MISIPSTGHGLVYPSSTGNVNIWEHIQSLAESVEAALDAYESFTSWTPTWDTTNGGGFTSVGGSGFNQGFYTQIGKRVLAQFRIQLASGFSVDTGVFLMNLPVAAYVFSGDGQATAVGHWIARNDSVPSHYTGTMGIWDTGFNKAYFGGAWDGTAPRSRVDSNDPITWASGDVLSGVLNYRAV